MIQLNDFVQTNFSQLTGWGLITLGAVSWLGLQGKKFWAWRRQGNHFPGPVPTLLSGNIQDITNSGGFQNFLPQLHQQYGTVARFWLGPSDLTVSVNDPNLIAKVVDHLDSRPRAANKLFEWLGAENLSFMPSEKSNITRTKLFPLLAGQSLKYLCTVSQDLIPKMLESWDNSAVEVDDQFRTILLDVMGICCFGEAFSQTSLGQEIKQLLIEILPDAHKRMEEVVPPFWQASYRRWKKNVRRLHECAQELIEQRKKDENIGNKKDLLSLILNEKNEDGSLFFSDNVARSTVVGFLFVGIDASASVAIWTTYLLSQHPQIQAKIKTEIDKVLGNRLPEFEDLENLKYLTGSIKEAMRIYAPAPLVLRRVESDLELDGYQIPQGATFCIPVCALHKNKESWESPEIFKPERFLFQDSETNRSRYAYLPFGIGSRACLGSRFGMVQIKMLLAIILQRFSLSLYPGQKIVPEMHVNLQSKYGLKLSLEESVHLKAH